MNNNIEVLNVNNNSNNDKKRLFIILIVILGIIAFVTIILLVTPNKNKETKNAEQTQENATALKQNKELVQITSNDITKSTIIEDDKIVVILTNTTKEAIQIDKIVIKADDKIIHESTEQILVSMEEPTTVTVLTENKASKVDVNLYVLKEPNNGSSTEPTTYEHICVSPTNNKNDYYSVEYYEFNYDHVLLNKSSYEILTFVSKEKYDTFDINNHTDSNFIISIDKDDEKYSIRYNYNYYYEPIEEIKDEEAYIKYLEEQGFNCK